MANFSVAVREAVVIRIKSLAPQHPPCFRGQEQWVEWLALAQASDTQRERPLRAGLTSFNSNLNFCIDCEPGQWRDFIRSSGRCKPDFLRGADGQDAAR